MDKGEVKKKVLQRLYNGAFKDDLTKYQADLKVVASEMEIKKELMERVCVELEREGFLAFCAPGMIAKPSFRALAHCENYQLGNKELIIKQNAIRKRILEAYANIYEETSSDRGDGWDEINRRTNINEQNFYNNIGILAYYGHIERNLVFDFWKITPKGRETVKDYRIKEQRRREFKGLVDLVEMTPQARGHRLELLLADVIRDEGWNVETNVKPKGKEYDIVINKGHDYFLISCKWKKAAIQPTEVENLKIRAHEMRCREGILVSMSGFTDNCIKEALKRTLSAEIVLFGFKDIKLPDFAAIFIHYTG